MPQHVQVFRARVRPDRVEALTAIRPKAVEEARAACPELLHAELVRVDEETWLDILTWSSPDGLEVLMSRSAGLPALGEMHALIEEVAEVRLGELVHSTRP
ncbi:MAG TPA: hypothetical protein VD813_07075 [Pseudonocardia sp.]|nr:hypothetical protein [Pseudonocardia sp.]